MHMIDMIVVSKNSVFNGLEFSTCHRWDGSSNPQVLVGMFFHHDLQIESDDQKSMNFVPQIHFWVVN